MLFFIVNFIGTGSSQAAAPVAAMNESVNRVANNATAAANTVATNIGNAMKNLTAAVTNKPANNRPAGNKPSNNVRFSQI